MSSESKLAMYDENSNAAAASALGTSSSSSGLMSQLLNVKDSRWLQLEVCREFQRGQCSRSDLECKFAHPPPHVDVQNGRVTACYDSIKGRCTRENPKCKYLHPPQHLKDQLLINGRNNLALKNLICTQLNQGSGTPTLSTMNPLAQLVVSGQASPALTDPLLLVQQQQQQQAAAAQAASLVPTALPYQYYQGIPTMYSTMVPVASTDAYQAQLQAQLVALQSLAAMSQQQQQPQPQPTVSLSANVAATAGPLSSATSQQLAAVAAAASSNRKRTLDDEQTAGTSLIDQNSLLLAAAAAAGGVPCKRPAVDKTGLQMYTNGAATAAQLTQMPQQFNPYLFPGLHGYMPAVSFSGQIPPRF